MHPILEKLFDKALNAVPITGEEAADICSLPASALLDCLALARLAASKGQAQPFTCGIVNAKSGLCKEDCAFCAQSAHHQANPPVYLLLSEDEILRRAELIHASGAERMGLVTSGTAPTGEDLDRLCRVAGKITASFPLKLCASLGLLDKDAAIRLRQAGFSRYHHNLETAASFYETICTSHPYQCRVDTVKAVQRAGMEICSGGIFGLGETWEQRIELSSLLAELDVNCIPINFLNPVAGTRMAESSPPAPREALTVLALFRLMHPSRHIVVCGGRDITLGRYAPMLFSAGANGLMIGDYLTTSGSPAETDREMLSVLGIAAAD